MMTILVTKMRTHKPEARELRAVEEHVPLCAHRVEMLVVEATVVFTSSGEDSAVFADLVQ